MNKKETWKSVLDLIQIKIDSPADFNAWFKNLELVSFENGLANIGCKSEYVIDWVKNYKELFMTSIEKVSGEKVSGVQFSISEKGKKNIKEELAGPLFEHMMHVQDDKKLAEDKILRAGLNKKYTFENFIVGSPNRLAHAAALAVADNPGTTYNPLYIYGGVGLGKTHLMQAVGIQILMKNPHAEIHYCSCESFLNELVDAIRSGKGNNHLPELSAPG